MSYNVINLRRNMNLIEKLTKKVKRNKQYLSAEEIKQKILTENKLPKSHGNKSLSFVEIHNPNVITLK